MDDNTTRLRLCYRATDVVITAQHTQTDLWHQTHTYPNHQLWLQQVYRTLNQTDQCNACIHEVVAGVDSTVWQPICEAVIVGLTMISSSRWAHVLCIEADEEIHSIAENWVRTMAAHYAPHGQRINGIQCPANINYVNYLLHRDSHLLSGAYFDRNGSMIRNGLMSSERILARVWHTHTSPHDAVHVS